MTQSQSKFQPFNFPTIILLKDVFPYLGLKDLLTSCRGICIDWTNVSNCVIEDSVYRVAEKQHIIKGLVEANEKYLQMHKELVKRRSQLKEMLLKVSQAINILEFICNVVSMYPDNGYVKLVCKLFFMYFNLGECITYIVNQNYDQLRFFIRTPQVRQIFLSDFKKILNEDHVYFKNLSTLAEFRQLLTEINLPQLNEYNIALNLITVLIDFDFIKNQITEKGKLYESSAKIISSVSSVRPRHENTACYIIHLMHQFK